MPRSNCMIERWRMSLFTFILAPESIINPPSNPAVSASPFEVSILSPLLVFSLLKNCPPSNPAKKATPIDGLDDCNFFSSNELDRWSSKKFEIHLFVVCQMWRKFKNFEKKQTWFSQTKRDLVKPNFYKELLKTFEISNVFFPITTGRRGLCIPGFIRNTVNFCFSVCFVSRFKGWWHFFFWKNRFYFVKQNGFSN